MTWTPHEPSKSVPQIPPPGSPDGALGSIVAVVATAAAREDGWAAQAALGIARDWAARGSRVFLLDLGLEAPELHELLGGVRGEGVSDAILFGGSIRRVARTLEGAGFFFASSGTPVADPAEVYGASRWASVLDGFLGAGVTLVLYVHAEAVGADALLSQATHNVLLAEASEDQAALLAGLWGENLAIAGPGVENPFLTMGRGPAALPGDELRGLAPGLKITDDPDEAVEWLDEEGLPPRSPDAPRPIERLPQGGAPVAKPRRGFVWAGLAAVVMALAWFGFGDRLGSGAGDPAALSDPIAAEPELPPPAPVGDVQGFSIAMGSYRDAGAAMSRAASLGGQVQGVLFMTVPVEVDGAIWWRVLAGPAFDSAGAEALRNVLALEIGGPMSTIGDNWLVRRTPLAFLLGEENTLDEARALASAFRDSGVPAYVLEMPYTDNSTRFRIYAGAFATPEEAEVLWRELEDIVTARPTLTDRLGHIPA